MSSIQGTPDPQPQNVNLTADNLELTAEEVASIKKILPQLLEISQGDDVSMGQLDEALSKADPGLLQGIKSEYFTDQQAEIDVYVVMAIIQEMTNEERQMAKEASVGLAQMSWAKIQERADKMRDAADKDHQAAVTKAVSDICVKSLTTASHCKNLSGLKGADAAGVQAVRTKGQIIDNLGGIASSSTDIAVAGVKKEADYIRAEIVETQKEEEQFKSWAEWEKDTMQLQQKQNDDNARNMEKIIDEKNKQGSAGAFTV